MQSRRADLAEALWNAAEPVTNSPAEAYLRGRGITCDLGYSFRFHPSAFHGTTRTRQPAITARIEGSGGFAVHRTYLCQDGRRKADVEPSKTMLGKTACGAVRLFEPHIRIPASIVRNMCGGVSDRTLHRWLNDPGKAFPRPIYIGRRRYWRVADIIAWLNAQAEQGRAS
ncbi:DUF7146 domain-containing protein [Pseudorhodobacter wandonensis]